MTELKLQIEKAEQTIINMEQQKRVLTDKLNPVKHGLTGHSATLKEKKELMLDIERERVKLGMLKQQAKIATTD